MPVHAPATPVELTVERLSKSGDGVAKWGERTVFVEGALPGEVVRARVHEGSVLRAEVLEVLRPSPARRVPPCGLAERCGGCTWLHLDEPTQRAAKEEIVLSTLEHLGGLERSTLTLLPTVFGARPMGYRRRAAMHPAEGGLGFHGRRTHERVRVERCPALVPELEGLPPRLAEALSDALKELDEVRLLSDRGVGVSLHLKGPVKPRVRTKAEALLKLVDAVVLVPPQGPAEVFGLARLRADGFVQANAEVNERLKAAAALALEGKGKRVLELYAGSGNYTAALGASEVVAVESSKVSVALAPKVPGVRWVVGEAEQVVKGLLAEGTRFDRLLLDPPRSGAPGVQRWALGLEVDRVVYVACDPAALARDAKALAQAGYAPKTLQLFDLFPQTHHVEALMRFDR